MGGLIKPDGIAAGIFGLVHRGIGPLQQIARRGLLAAEHHHAQAGGAAVIDQVLSLAALADPQREGLGEGRPNFFSDDRCALPRYRLVCKQVTEQDHKLVTAKAGHRVGLALALFQLLRHLAQQRIADVVPMVVVHQFEFIPVGGSILAVIQQFRADRPPLNQCLAHPGQAWHGRCPALAACAGCCR